MSKRAAPRSLDQTRESDDRGRERRETRGQKCETRDRLEQRGPSYTYTGAMLSPKGRGGPKKRKKKASKADTQSPWANALPIYGTGQNEPLKEVGFGSLRTGNRRLGKERGTALWGYYLKRGDKSFRD